MSAPAQPAIRVKPGQVFDASAMVAVEHDLGRHPLLQLPALRSLAQDLLPLGGCRFVTAPPRAESSFEHQATHPEGLGIDQVFDSIEQSGSWIALYNVERIPRYQHLLEQALGSVRSMVEAQESEIFLVTGFIFLSAPPSVTPFHIDRENNFWLQLKGRKTLGLWDRRDPRNVPADVVEDFMVFRDLSRVRLDPQIRERCLEFDCGAGEGMYFPSTTPHMTHTTDDWVTSQEGVSISIGITFYTATTRRQALAYQANRLLRRLGLAPRPPAERPWLDRLKMPLGWIAVQLLKWRRPGYQAPPGLVRPVRMN